MEELAYAFSENETDFICEILNSIPNIVNIEIEQ